MLARKKNSTTIKDTLLAAIKILQAAKVESASLDARILLEHVLGRPHEWLLLNDATVLTLLQSQTYATFIERRAKREPMAHILGRREFWSMDFKVTSDTLDPRADSETLVQMALEVAPHRGKALRILDMGTGTGCLLLSLLSELPQATGVGADISEGALSVALANAEALGLKNRVEFVKSDWNSRVTGVFDIVVSNPPYIPSEEIPTLAPEVAKYEPKLALDGGKDGLSCYRIILSKLKDLLAEDGFAVLEIGAGQLEALKKIAEENSLKLTGVRQDLAGIPRSILLTK